MKPSRARPAATTAPTPENKNANKTLILSAFVALLPYPVGWLMGL